MRKTEAGLVARSVEPPLVPAKHLSIERSGINVLAGRAGVSAQPRLAAGFAFRRGLRRRRARAVRNFEEHNADDEQKRTPRADAGGSSWRCFGNIHGGKCL